MIVNREDLKAFVDGELSSTGSEAIARELREDQDLAEQVTLIKLIGQGVRECASEVPVRGVQETLHRCRRGRRPLTLVEIAGICFCCLVLGSFFVPVLAQSKLASKILADRATSEASATAEEFSPAARNLEVASGAKIPKVAPSAPAQASVGGAEKAKFGLSRNSLHEDVDGNGTLQGHTPQMPPVSAGDQNRMVVQNGDLEEVVRDASTAQTMAMSYAKGVGGYVESSELNSSRADTPVATMTVRVPARMFSSAMDHFKSLAVDGSHVKSVNVSGQDVTAQYADATARLKVMTAEEDSYVTMLRGARKIGEILEIKDRLSSVREQIESLKAQSASLKNQSSLSTINLTFDQLPRKTASAEPNSWSSETWTSAVNGLHEAVQFLATLLIYAFVYSPIWLPLGLVGIWIYRRSR